MSRRPQMSSQKQMLLADARHSRADDANRGAKASPEIRGSVGSIFSHINALKMSMATIGSSGRS